MSFTNQKDEVTIYNKMTTPETFASSNRPKSTVNIEGIKLLTKILVDNKQGLKDDLNYDINTVDNNNNIKSEKELLKKDIALNNGIISSQKNKILNEAARNTVYISKGARANAERVRSYLDYFYAILERNMTIRNDGRHKHENIEGIYNPLQLIRNRKIRKKYDESPPRVMFVSRSPIIAIKKFSSKPNRKFPWYVDISERASDLSWRTAHWNELIGPDGEPWVKLPNSNHKYKHIKHFRTHSGHNHISTASFKKPSLVTHDSYGTSSKATEEDINGDKLQHNLNANLSPDMHDSVSDLSDEQKEESTQSERGRVKKLGKMIEKSKQWSKSPTFKRKTMHLWKILLQIILERLTKGSSNISLNESVLESSQSTQNSINCNNTSPEQRSNNLQNVPIKTIRNKNEKETLSKSSVNSQSNSLNVPMSSSRSSKIPKNTNMTVSDSYPHKELILDMQLQRYQKDIRYIKATIGIMQNRIQTHKKFKSCQLKKRIATLNVDDDSNAIGMANDILNIYNKKLDEVLKEGNDWNSKWINDYSIRVETLISSIDRIMTDVNTTLTLKLKLFQESAEKHVSLRNLRARKFSKIGYKLLELFIVLFLWSIWFIVMIFRNIRFAFFLLLNVIKWLLW
ncbi:hypothetical protein TPHA_0C04400 [Tetrapisispora phaffii CBS 4417]|uniref:Maintenance of telomere capping protein 4 n=1 Tax=Tetrapisispora phaffii (strain ATCC 24235 / CBS 4417 / NBRC 1672 / NRRL Y-8282 / UCD 70-5) TaxID=1071381 RepID=G8BQS8_TETPH|nr:hypothetical protein TPHA_0C04400 [Tetrapisispora phaffii CBS 4417]CCE62590.1 hypothetical protein TPHA_0C04400 [Tetrapisispora phaffii CBS 4417]